jgi:TonB-linked SusC/RagA family outer membrane protein
MKKLLLASLCFLMLCASQVYAQNRTVTGTVKAKEDGLPLPGASVTVKGTVIGTQTNANGRYSISVPANGKLVFTFIGYKTIEVSPAGSTADVTLESSANMLSEVVVNTAFGVKKTAGSLGYAATTIGTKELNQGGATNFTNGLTAKVAGLVVVTGDNGIDPSTRFTLRGSRHIVGNNFALVVLNGVPISPNDVNTLNPDDIESTDVLNGPSAAALYGSEASNGVIVITTKKGSRSGAPLIGFTSTYQLEKLAYFPNLQTRFGSYGGEGVPFADAVTGFITTVPGYENQSYGPAYDGHLEVLGIPLQDGTLQKYAYSTPSVDPRYALFQTGHSATQNLSYAQGDDKNSFNLSANHLDRTNPTPGEKYTRNVVRISAGRTYGMFKADFTASYTSAYTNLTSYNLYSTLVNTPSWVPLQNFQDINAPFGDRSTFFNSYDQNPYAGLHDNRTNRRLDAFNGSFTGTLTPAKWVDITYRLANNFGNITSQNTVAQKNYSAYALSDPGATGNQASSAGVALVPGSVTNTTQFGDGSFFSANSNAGLAGPQGYSRLTQDIIANFHRDFFTDFKTNLRVGNTIWQEYGNQQSNNSPNLLIENFYNISFASGIPTVGQYSGKIRQIAYFGALDIGYKDWANIEGTLRNEHDSRLSDANRSIWFPSVNASVILSNALPALKGNKVINYLKLRGTYAQVGDINLGPYGYIPASYGVATNFPYGSLAGLSLGTTLNNPTLKPELTKEVEFGIDFGLFDGRINAGVTYYNDHTTNQTLPINTTPSIGYTNTLVNIGEVQNKGYEFRLDAEVVQKQRNRVGVSLGGNLAIQDSKVISLINGLNSVSIGSNEQALVGSPFPVLVSNDLVRDPQGRVVVSGTTGYPSTATALVNLGRTTPKYILGLNQTVTYKFVTLKLVEEFRTGNVFYDGTERSSVIAGSAGFSASNGRARFVFPNSVINTGTAAAPNYVPNTNVAVRDGNLLFWDSGSFYTVASTYTTSAAFWKLREANLEFDVTQWVKKTKAIKRASLAINGRNLLMIVPASNRFHTDPEFGSTGNAVGSQTTSQLPPSRFFGATLNLTF